MSNMLVCLWLGSKQGDELDNDEVNNGLGKDAIIVKELFDHSTYELINSFMDSRVPFMSLGVDNDSFVRRFAHNVPFFRDIHEQLKDFASEMFGESLKPSYSFLSMYEDNGICPLHIDRPQCYRTIDYLIRQDQQDPWPILIGEAMSNDQREIILNEGKAHPQSDEEIQQLINSENWSEINLYPNDAVLYSGTNSWHYRPQRLKGKADLVFFHFVQENFDGPLD